VDVAEGEQSGFKVTAEETEVHAVGGWQMLHETVVGNLGRRANATEIEWLG
jgi:hypothetical protein